MSKINSSPGQTVICLAGPTGSGKSAAALFLARELSGSIINADSRQVYRDFPIITAQPAQEERKCCPHTLYAFLDCREKLSAARYAELARQEITNYAAINRVPIVVGGTGLYIDALLRGMPEIPAVPPEVSQKWQERCAHEGPQALHALLLKRDPVCAAKIHPNDSQRVSRALEVEEATGTPLSVWQKQPVAPSGLNALVVGIEMSLTELSPRLEKRIDAMLAAGGVAEAERALAHCPDSKAPGWSGIGCAELYRHITGAISLDECRSLWIKNTRAYAKRQITWFKRDQQMLRLRPDALRAMLAACREHLALQS